MPIPAPTPTPGQNDPVAQQRTAKARAGNALEQLAAAVRAVLGAKDSSPEELEAIAEKLTQTLEGIAPLGDQVKAFKAYSEQNAGSWWKHGR